MYQEFFQLRALPFSLTSSVHFFCQLKGHQDALDMLQFCIQSNEGFIKVIGEVGSGKTLLCRKLLDYLDHDHYMTAYIPNPDLCPIELRKAVARELGLDPTQWHDQHELLTSIYQRLIALYASEKKVVLLIDEAQALSDESLETVRLLTNLETENAKLLQVVLFGQPELDKRLNQAHLRQLNQRIVFSCRLPLMKREDLDFYLNHRLAVAGHTKGDLFTAKAKDVLYRASAGIPRVVNILSHKALLVAYGKGSRSIDHRIIRVAVNDTEVAKLPNRNLLIFIGIGVSILFLLTTIAAYLIGNR